MTDFNSFVKTAEELQLTHEYQVVKVAGILDRLKKLWQQITNPQYRKSVSHLGDEFHEAQLHLEQMQDHFADLSTALEIGDLKGYSDSLNQIKVLIGKFLDDLKEADKKTKEIFQWTLKEMQSPGFIEKVVSSLPKDYGIEYGKNYENAPLLEFVRYKNINPSVFMSPAAQRHFGLKAIAAVDEVYDGEEDLKNYFFANENTIKSFEQAILRGNLIAARPYSPRKEEKATTGQTIITVQTAPFEIPGLGAVVQAVVELNDQRISLDDKKRMSLRQTVEVKLAKDAPPKVAQAAQGQQVPYERHQLSELQLAEALREGYKKAFGEDPSLETLAGGFSQAILESGWPIYLPNYNIGNIKASGDWITSGRPYFVKGTIEFTPDGKKINEHGTKWRAYESASDGAAGYWKLIGGRYKKALDWYASGDPESAAVALAMKGYYTAPVTKYAYGLNMHHKRFLEKIAPQLPGLESNAKPPPGAKPLLKKWYADYTPEERNDILKTEMVAKVEEPQKPEPAELVGPNEPANDIDPFNQLMYKLVANDGIITKIVKKSILEETLPENDVLIYVNSEEPYEARLEYGRVCASFLRDVLDATVEICSDGNKVELQCSAHGNSDTLLYAVAAVAKIVATGMRIKTAHKIKPTIVSGLISKHAEIAPEELLSNHRKFSLKRIGHG